MKDVLANNGREAVEMVGQQHFDVVLMDMQMPVMDALESTRQIQDGSLAAIVWILAMIVMPSPKTGPTV